MAYWKAAEKSNGLFQPPALQEKPLTLAERWDKIEDQYAQLAKQYENIKCPDIPDGFLDIFTKGLINTPVSLPDGHNYDKDSVLKMLELKQNKCPQNPKLTFLKKDLITQYDVRKLLEQFVIDNEKRVENLAKRLAELHSHTIDIPQADEGSQFRYGSI